MPRPQCHCGITTPPLSGTPPKLTASEHSCERPRASQSKTAQKRAPSANRRHFDFESRYSTEVQRPNRSPPPAEYFATFPQFKPRVGGPTGNVGPRPVVVESGWSEL